MSALTAILNSSHAFNESRNSSLANVGDVLPTIFDESDAVTYTLNSDGILVFGPQMTGDQIKAEKFHYRISRMAKDIQKMREEIVKAGGVNKKHLNFDELRKDLDNIVDEVWPKFRELYPELLTKADCPLPENLAELVDLDTDRIELWLNNLKDNEPEAYVQIARTLETASSLYKLIKASEVEEEEPSFNIWSQSSSSVAHTLQTASDEHFAKLLHENQEKAEQLNNRVTSISFAVETLRNALSKADSDAKEISITDDIRQDLTHIKETIWPQMKDEYSEIITKGDCPIPDAFGEKIDTSTIDHIRNWLLNLQERDRNAFSMITRKLEAAAARNELISSVTREMAKQEVQRLRTFQANFRPIR